MRTKVPANAHAVMVKRIESVRRLHFQNLDLETLPTRARSFGVDCYLQGLIDGAGIGAKNPSLVDGIEYPETS